MVRLVTHHQRVPGELADIVRLIQQVVVVEDLERVGQHSPLVDLIGTNTFQPAWGGVGAGAQVCCPGGVGIAREVSPAHHMHCLGEIPHQLPLELLGTAKVTCLGVVGRRYHTYQ